MKGTWQKQDIWKLGGLLAQPAVAFRTSDYHAVLASWHAAMVALVNYAAMQSQQALA